MCFGVDRPELVGVPIILLGLLVIRLVKPPHECEWSDMAGEGVEGEVEVGGTARRSVGAVGC